MYTSLSPKKAAVMFRPQNPNTEKPEKVFECPHSVFDQGPFEDQPSVELGGTTDPRLIKPWTKVRVMGDYQVADLLRKACWKEPAAFGGELVARTEKDHQGTFQMMYKVPLGTYYEHMKAWTYEQLDAMESGKVYFLKLRDVDAIQNVFHFAKEWQKERATIARVTATYEGLKLTLRALKPINLNPREAAELSKYLAKRVSMDKPKDEKKSTNNRPTKPYHTIQINESVLIKSSEFSSIPGLRSVIYTYGVKTGKRFTVTSAGEDANVTRISTDDQERRGSSAVRPYHDLEIGDSTYMAPTEYTTLISLRSIISTYGVRKGQKYKVSVASDTRGVTVTRIS